MSRVTIRENEVLPLTEALNQVPLDQWNNELDIILQRLYEVIDR